MSASWEKLFKADGASSRQLGLGVAAVVFVGVFGLGVLVWALMPSPKTPKLDPLPQKRAAAAPRANPTPAAPRANAAPAAAAPRQAPAAPRANPAPAAVSRLAEVPTLETQRAKADVPGQSSISQLTADFECALAPNPVKVSDTHFQLDFQNKDSYFFFFRLTGVAGKTVRIDLKNVALNKWWSLNPVYRYPAEVVAELPMLPDNFKLTDVKTVAAHNGPLLPDTTGQAWHFISNVWTQGGSTLSLVQTFEKDEVLVAMKVPFTLDDEKALVEETRLAATKDPGIEVVDIGKTPEGRMLHLIKLSSGGAEGEHAHPCILMYAREHADEQDSSWVVAGALRRLLHRDDRSQELRRGLTLLFIPILDMDAAAKSEHERIIMTFRSETPSEESKSYANFFHSWVAAGGRLDIVLDMHNVESAEGGHLTWVVPADQETRNLANSMHDAFRTDLSVRGFTVDPKPWQLGTLPLRLGTWLTDNFGSILLPYETNSQQPGRHLSQTELQAMGSMMAVKSSAFFASTQGKSLLAKVDEARKAYAVRWEKYGREIKDIDALTAEQRCLYKARSDELLRQFEAGEIGSDGKPVKR